MNKKIGILFSFSICFSYGALPYNDLVVKYSAQRGLDPLLVHALIQQESRHNPKICSEVGACGLMQLMPGTAKDMGVGVDERFNPEKI